MLFQARGKVSRGAAGAIPYWWSRTSTRYQTREATVWLDMPALGVDREFIVTDELTGESYRWGHANYVRLDPATRPAHIFTVTPAA